MKSWKTTLIGCLAGAFNAAISVIQTGNLDPHTIAISAGLAALGIAAKDFNVSHIDP